MHNDEIFPEITEDSSPRYFPFPHWEPRNSHDVYNSDVIDRDHYDLWRRRALWRLNDDSIFYDDANMTSLYVGHRKSSKETICGQRPFESPTYRVLRIHAHLAFPYTLEWNDVCMRLRAHFHETSAGYV